MARVQIVESADSGRALDVVLSERNLILLLSHLYMPGRRLPAIVVGDIAAEFERAVVRAEPDELHYASPTREGTGPGPLHPLSAMFLVAVRAAIDDLVAQTIIGEPGTGPVLWPPSEEG